MLQELGGVGQWFDNFHMPCQAKPQIRIYSLLVVVTGGLTLSTMIIMIICSRLFPELLLLLAHVQCTSLGVGDEVVPKPQLETCSSGNWTDTTRLIELSHTSWRSAFIRMRPRTVTHEACRLKEAIGSGEPFHSSGVERFAEERDVPSWQRVLPTSGLVRDSRYDLIVSLERVLSGEPEIRKHR